MINGHALDHLGFPAFVLDLPSRVIAAVNCAAAEAFGLTVEAMLGQTVDAVLRLENPIASLASTAALGDGTIDGYRAERHITGGDGVTRNYTLWIRAITYGGVRHAVGIMALKGAQGMALRVHPLEPLVIGCTDTNWIIEHISSDVGELCGCPAQEVVGRSLLGAVHPDDVPLLLRAEALAAERETVALRHMRMRFDARDGWGQVRMMMMPFRQSHEFRVAFALLPVESEPVASYDRAADLESRLRRIAAELRSAGVLDGIELLPRAADHPELNRLSSRQWEILVRLLRGERVPAIARELFLSPRTVRNHLSQIFAIFGVHSQPELIALLRHR